VKCRGAFFFLPISASELLSVVARPIFKKFHYVGAVKILINPSEEKHKDIIRF